MQKFDLASLMNDRLAENSKFNQALIAPIRKQASTEMSPRKIIKEMLLKANELEAVSPKLSHNLRMIALAAVEEDKSSDHKDLLNSFGMGQ